MKKIYTVLFACMACLSINANSFTITTTAVPSYSSSALTVTVGDVVTIEASSPHPLAEVDATVWAANGTTTLTGGFGIKTTNYTFTVTNVGTIYFVCQAHVSSFQMKGRIDVVAASGITENFSSVKNLNLFPNPASNKLVINFGVTSSTNVNAKLINMLGQEVEVLISNTKLSANDYSYSIELPATITSGAYFVVINTNDKRITKKLIISK